MNITQLKFVYAYPLDGNQRREFEAATKEYPSQSEIKEIIVHWRELWSETDKTLKIIDTITKLTKRTPERNLECFVYGAGLNAMSTPFLMPTRNRKGNKWTDEYLVQTIIHEMLHIFLTSDNDKYWEMVRSKYAKEELVCQNHIILYAMLCEVYKICFKYDPPDFSRDNLPSGYARAIEVVKEEGSDVLVAEYQSIVI
jgi:hypothetical protein